MYFLLNKIFLKQPFQNYIINTIQSKKNKTMKTTTFIALSLVVLLCQSCADNDAVTTTDNSNKVLLLKVDYETNTFEGGKEFEFNTPANQMTLTTEYVTPADFGSIKLMYQELDVSLFDGTIVWNGLGQMNYPNNLLPANQFESVNTTDFVYPIGYDNVFNPNNTIYEYNPVWISVQKLIKVRQYLISNPNATVKIFLYTPSVGYGNPADWDWIIFMKN